MPVPVRLAKFDKNVPRLIVGLPETPSESVIPNPAPTAIERPVSVFGPVLTCIPVPLEFSDDAAPVRLICSVLPAPLSVKDRPVLVKICRA